MRADESEGGIVLKMNWKADSIVLGARLSRKGDVDIEFDFRLGNRQKSWYTCLNIFVKMEALTVSTE